MAKDILLRSRVQDLLHLLSFAKIETPTPVDLPEAEKAMAEIRHILHQPAEATWRDIETAPRDGTWILLAGGQTNEEVQFCDGTPKLWTDRPVVGAFEADEEGYWTFSYWDSGWRSEYMSPTHWMPLPPPLHKTPCRHSAKTTGLASIQQA